MMTPEERARRKPWAEVEYATHDASRDLFKTLELLPPGEAADELLSIYRSVDSLLNEAAAVAQAQV